MIQNEKKHFLLLKRSGFSTNGELMTARESAQALMDCGFWPLHKNTPCKNMVKPGHKVLIYLSGPEHGCRSVIASGEVKDIVEWRESYHRSRYPLMLESEPTKVLNIHNIHIFEKAVSIRDNLSSLSFVPKKNPMKWGAVMMGGMKSLTVGDYNVLFNKASL